VQAAWVTKAVDVLERALVRHWFKNNGERSFGLSAGFPSAPSDQFCLDRFEEDKEDQKTVRGIVFQT